MESVLDVFRTRISNQLLPEFCNDPTRNLMSYTFQEVDWGKVREEDAADCLRSIDGGLVEHVGRGQYRAPHGNKEQFFNHGDKGKCPRSIYLRRETIIAMAVLARFHFDLGWAKQSLGLESKGGAFDAATYLSSDSHVEHIACEVKKSTAELEQLIELMIRFGRDPSDKPMRKQEENAFKKIQALRSRRPPLFWAVGPGGSNNAFRIGYTEDGSVRFDEIPTRELSYPAAIGGKPT